MRRPAAALLIAVLGLIVAAGADARATDDLSLPAAHQLAQQYAPDILLPPKVPAGITRVAYLQVVSYTPGVKSADIGMTFHGGRTAPQFQLFIWRARLRSTIVRAMTVTFRDPGAKQVTSAFKAGRFSGTKVSSQSAQVIDNYIWESAGNTYALSLFTKRLGKTMNPWSKTAVIASFRAP